MSTEHKVALTFEGADRVDIVCRQDEDVITAAFRQGYLLLTECREGSCATCRGFLVDGEYDALLSHSPHALTDDEEDEGYILACRLQPTSDLEIDFDYPLDRVGRYEDETRAGQIVAVERLSATVARMLVRTNASQEPLAWDPGQYVQVTMPAIGATRSYSMANAAGGRDLEMLIRLLPDGRFSGHVASGLATGEPVRLRGPFGSFTFRGDARSVFIAGGTGLAPILAILRSLADAEPAPFKARLIFGVATEEDLFAGGELTDLARALPDLEVVTTVERPTDSWSGATGLVTDHLGDADPSGTYYLCGPTAMIGACEALLDANGVARSRIHAERFLETGDETP